MRWLTRVRRQQLPQALQRILAHTLAVVAALPQQLLRQQAAKHRMLSQPGVAGRGGVACKAVARREPPAAPPGTRRQASEPKPLQAPAPVQTMHAGPCCKPHLESQVAGADRLPAALCCHALLRLRAARGGRADHFAGH